MSPPPSSITVLVTGGSGFVGSYVILQLLAAGYTVRTTVRSLAREDSVRTALSEGGASSEDLERLSFIAADLQSDAGWAEAVEGTTYVHHVASPFPLELPKHEDDLIVPARDGTLRVLKAAQAAGVKRVILTSSAAAVSGGYAPTTEPFTEKNWTKLDSGVPVAPYYKSKTIAERAAWDFMAKDGGSMELTTICPVAVFGPVLGSPLSTSIQIIKKLMDGSIPGCPALYFSAVDVRDVASLHLLAMKSPAAAGERFIAVNDEKAFSLIQIGKLLKSERPGDSKKVPTIQVPKFVVRVLALFDAPLKQILPGLGHAVEASNEKAKTVLGWSPRSSEQSFLDTADSLVKHKLI